MPKKPDNLAQFKEWREELDTAVQEGSAKRIDTATRAVLSIGTILHVYQPNDLSTEVMDEVAKSFKSALELLLDRSEKRESRDDTSEDYETYTEFVSDRYSDWLNLYKPAA